VRSAGVVEGCVAYVKAEIEGAARVTATSGFSDDARAGMTAIERGLDGYLSSIIAAASEEEPARSSRLLGG
jgi:hypothetical protein